jgi:hypothetical protein
MDWKAAVFAEPAATLIFKSEGRNLKAAPELAAELAKPAEPRAEPSEEPELGLPALFFKTGSTAALFPMTLALLLRPDATEIEGGAGTAFSASPRPPKLPALALTKEFSEGDWLSLEEESFSSALEETAGRGENNSAFCPILSSAPGPKTL